MKSNKTRQNNKMLNAVIFRMQLRLIILISSSNLVSVTDSYVVGDPITM